MKKLNREAFAKYASRFFLVLMSFLLILSLCSMASPTGEFELTIQNPDNIPQNYVIEYGMLYADETLLPLSFGKNNVFGSISTGEIGGDQIVPYGHYSAIAILAENSVGGTSLTCNGTAYEFIVQGATIPVYVSDNPILSVTDETVQDVSGFVVFVPIEPPTSSITSVWTSITNWVISSLNTVQGVFYGAGEEVITPDTTSSDTVVYNGVTYYPIDFMSASEVGGVSYYNGVEITEGSTTGNQVTIDGISYTATVFDGSVVSLFNLNTYNFYSPVGLTLLVPSEGSLTLLGTFAVIGLSISLAFLVIGLIQRFLKLRG